MSTKARSKKIGHTFVDETENVTKRKYQIRRGASRTPNSEKKN